MILWAIGLIVAFFLLVVLRGAPYVPTHAKQVHHAVELLDIPKGGTVIDLGSGDGVFLKAAAAKGYHAVGYELNPILCLISYLRCWQHRKLVTVKWRDFWLTPLPQDADAVFVFLAGPYLSRLESKLLKERTKPLTVISYGFLIPGKYQPAKSEDALHVYHF